MFAIASFTAMAQDGFHHGPRHAEDPLTPEQVATLQTKRMTLALDLTKLQQEKIEKINLENARLRQEKMEARKDDPNGKPGRTMTSEDRFALQNERLDQMIANKQKMKSILNQEQYEKWEKTMEHRKHHGNHRRKDRPGKR